MVIRFASILFAALLACPLLLAAERPQHLLLVDTSFSMGRKRSDTALSIRRVIESQFGGVIKGGQKFSVWTFSDDVNVRAFPDQVWSQPDAALQADLVNRFLKTQKHTGRARLDVALEHAGRFMADAPEAWVFIVTDSSEAFDSSITDPWLQGFTTEFRERVKRSRKPTIASLASRQGVALAWAIDGGAGPVTVAQLPPAPEALRAPTISSAPNAASSQPIIQAAPAEPRVLKAPTVTERLLSSVKIVPPDTAPTEKPPAVAANTELTPLAIPQITAVKEPIVTAEPSTTISTPGRTEVKEAPAPTVPNTAPIVSEPPVKTPEPPVQPASVPSATVKESEPVSTPQPAISAIPSQVHAPEPEPPPSITQNGSATIEPAERETPRAVEPPVLSPEAQPEIAPPVAARAPAASNVIAIQAQSLIQPPGTLRWKVILASLAGLIVFVGALMLLKKRSPSRPSSLISKSLNDPRR